MNPLVRLIVALVVAVLVVLIQPGNVVAWVFGVIAFFFVMGSGHTRGGRRRY